MICFAEGEGKRATPEETRKKRSTREFLRNAQRGDKVNKGEEELTIYVTDRFRLVIHYESSKGCYTAVSFDDITIPGKN